MNRYRLISSIIVLYIYLLLTYPAQTILFTTIILVAYFSIKNGIKDTVLDTEDNTKKRRFALNTAKIYLAPYNDIWKNLKLSNKYCSLRLGRDGNTITAKDLKNSNRSFIVIRSEVHSNSDLWDMFCTSFSYNTTFDELVRLCERFNVQISITGDESQVLTDNTESPVQSYVPQENIRIAPKEKLDVNNASEVELTALPGVSIVMAKKLIKRREELGGFKSVSDVCLCLKLKPHMQKQLEQLICVKKMRGSLNIKRYEERKLDL